VLKINTNNIDWELVYRSLIESIRTNSGYGFHNANQGHTAYILGAIEGEPSHSAGHAEMPEKNSLYQTLKEICENGNVPRDLPRIDNWKAFCELAVESHRRANSLS